MEGYLIPILMVLAAVGGALFMKDKKKRDDVKQQVGAAADSEAKGKIDATLEFAERVKDAEIAVDAAIDARPDIANPADRLADRVRRSREQRRARRQRNAGSS